MGGFLAFVIMLSVRFKPPDNPAIAGVRHAGAMHMRRSFLCSLLSLWYSVR